MKYVIYCDESRQDHNSHNHFMAIGGLWVERDKKDILTFKLKTLKRELGISGELKWSKVSAAKLDSYKKIIDFFFEETSLRFRTIVVQHDKVDLDYHEGDCELGFYKFYYEMLIKWLSNGDEFLILLDEKSNKGANRHEMLKRCLVNTLKNSAKISDLSPIHSGITPLAQLSDLLTGCIAATWCGIDPHRPKFELASHIASHRFGRNTDAYNLRIPDASPAISKFNIFNINLG